MRPPLLLDMNLSPEWAPRVAVVLITIIALVAATGCWLEEDDAGGSDEDRSELREYAAAMDIWWREVYGRWLVEYDAGGFGSILGVDHQRVLEDPASGYYGSNPLSSVEPPYSMEMLHDMLVSTVFALASAESEADVQGFYAGVAAAFCDPLDVGGVYASSGLLWWDVAPLQIWRWDGDPCHEGHTWAGVYRKTGDPWRDFQWGCRFSSLDTDILEFRVSDIDLERACLNALRWSRAFDSTTHLWSAELIRLCGGQLEVWRIPDPVDALATCE